MRGYEKDEYEDWDEYEEDGEEQGDDGYEEVHQPTQEELDYLAIRQKLKEKIRKKMMKDTRTANLSSRDKVNASHKDNYGSFFGPSQPVIAQRVIQESKSLLENPELAARFCKTSHKEKKSSVSAPVSSKSQANCLPSVKKKVELLKNTRDYSFLLSDDAEVPASSKGPPPRNVSAPKSDARSAKSMPRSRPVINGRGREVSNGRDGRKPMLPCSQSKSKVGMDKLAQTNKPSTDSRKLFGNNSGSGPGRPLGPKVAPAKSSVPTSSPLQPVARRPTLSNLPSGKNRPIPSHGQPSTLRRPVQKDYHGTNKPKVISKQSLPSSKVQLKRSPPRRLPCATLRDERPKAKPKRQLRDDDSDGDNAINLIRKMFGYNPNKFRDDDDTADMEANFDDIMKEEKRSARIAKQEDEEQLRLIEEEERRERMRQAKKRKMI
ncbi:protein spt2-like [Salvia miltiorrhiza]|uniref:protein spt2-like n=1 Tax=Salvia miltiorrhiza TaxID=226208 RepID=UPI0025AC00E2|nr:protein spt2-like [Salvia miltiorrhiza]